MKKAYSSIIVVLVAVVFILGLTLINKNRENDQVVKSTKIENQITNNNMENEIERIEKENGLIIEILEKGDGSEAQNGQVVSVHYTGKLEDGTVFDSSVSRGVPFEFNLGVGMVIQGWDQGVLGMKIGEKRRLTIPSDLAYGPRGIGSIPGGATLIFEVELLEVK